MYKKIKPDCFKNHRQGLFVPAVEIQSVQIAIVRQKVFTTNGRTRAKGRQKLKIF